MAKCGADGSERKLLNASDVTPNSYKSGESVKLTPTTWEYVADQFLTANGSALSDHTPIEVTFKLS